jgi:hypothetical protein
LFHKLSSLFIDNLFTTSNLLDERKPRAWKANLDSPPDVPSSGLVERF